MTVLAVCPASFCNLRFHLESRDLGAQPGQLHLLGRDLLGAGRAQFACLIKRKIYKDRAQARSDVFDYIELFYNPRRRHGFANQLSPLERGR